MRYLGIDYGTKRVGVAISDEAGEFALPFSVLPNDKKLLTAITTICREKNIGEIVLGESKNFAGEDNPLQEKINQFKKELEETVGLPIKLEPEFFTSAEAARLQGKNEKLDASAAALILKSFLDKKTAK
ncbi:MAG: Holliday junction resolvase RuvX [Candidatus Paceibacterota bacterium]|jgi:putative Holliday junction resolvase